MFQDQVTKDHLLPKKHQADATMQGSQPFTRQTPLSLRILSHNIRYATSSPSMKEKPWPERFPLILNELSYNTRPYSDNFGNASFEQYTTNRNPPTGVAFICLQEVLHTQLLDILNGLNGLTPQKGDSALPTGPLWAHIGVGREDGHTKGEYSPIIYPVQHLKLLHFENLWLSPTPDRPSKGWDAGCERILTTGVFEHKLTGQQVLACCTHLDHAGSKSRKKGVDLILATIDRLRKDWSADEVSFHHPNSVAMGSQKDLGVFLAGDFNSLPDQEAYLAMQGSDLMCDLRDYVDPPNRYGDLITFTGFAPDQSKDEQGRIDFIWLGPKQEVSGRHCLHDETDAKSNVIPGDPRWRVEGYAVLPNVFEDGVYSSDHRCVVGDVSLYTPWSPK